MDEKYIYVNMNEIKCSTSNNSVIGTSGLSPCFGVLIYNREKKMAIVAHSDSNNLDLNLELLDVIKKNNLESPNLFYKIIPGYFVTNSNLECIKKLNDSLLYKYNELENCNYNIRTGYISLTEGYNEFLFDAKSGKFVTDEYLDIIDNSKQK